jgi:arylsulfatase A-like enzyme
VAFLKREHRQPFLLVASFHNPHDICEWANGKKGYPIGTPDAPSDKWPALPKNFAIPPDEPDAVRQERATWPKAIHPTVGWNEAKWRQYRFAYYRLVEKVDAEIDRLLKALREQDLEEKTVVVFSSDHGDGLAAHHWNQKWVLYEESVRVPFIVSFKGVTRPAVVDRTHLVSAGLDLFPTVCDYAGIQPPEGLRGASVRDLAEGRTPARWRDDVVVETNLGGDARMLRTARFKYMVYARGERREQLIDLQQDPGEMVNLAADPKYASVLAEHRKRLAAWCAKVGDPFDVPK